MNADTRKAIKDLLRDKLTSKFENYEADTEYKPFFQAIFKPEQIITASIIQSFYTSFGMSVYEQIAVILAEGAGYEAERQYKLMGEIDKETEALIQSIHHQLRQGGTPDEEKETEKIRKSIQPGKEQKDPDSTVDLYVKKPDGKEYYFDITTVKPNKKEFATLKRKFLRWTALRLSQDKEAEVYTGAAMPYNPYYPKEYQWWTTGNMYDDRELLVGRDFWNFVAGEEVFDEMLEVFKEIGEELQDQIGKIAEEKGDQLELQE